MKTNKLLFTVLMLVVLAACKKEEEATNFPPEVDLLRTDLIRAFDTLNNQLFVSGEVIASKNGDSALIRPEMVKLFGKTKYVTDVAYTTTEGIMQVIEPPAYYSQQGTDISGQAHFISVAQSKHPAISSSFLAAEGFYAVVNMQALLIENDLKGYLSAMVKPEEMLAEYVKPLVDGKDFEIFIMEKGGRIMYDVDQSKIGTNVFVDIRYMLSPEMIESAKIIDEQQHGETDYTFLEIDASEPVHKRAYWTTFSMHGAEWKLILIKEEAHEDHMSVH